MPFGPATLLDHIVIRAKKQIPDLILNVNGDPDRVLSCGCDVIADNFPDAGPLGGILAAMTYGQDHGYGSVVTFSGDSPFFPDDYVARLIGAAAIEEKWVISVAKSADKFHPVMGCFDVSLRDDLAAYITCGERRVMGWIRRHHLCEVVWNSASPDPFFNINTPAELAEAEKYL